MFHRDLGIIATENLKLNNRCTCTTSFRKLSNLKIKENFSLHPRLNNLSPLFLILHLTCFYSKSLSFFFVTFLIDLLASVTASPNQFLTSLSAHFLHGFKSLYFSCVHEVGCIWLVIYQLLIEIPPSSHIFLSKFLFLTSTIYSAPSYFIFRFHTLLKQSVFV